MDWKIYNENLDTNLSTKLHIVLFVVIQNLKMSDFTLQVSDFTLRALLWPDVKFQTY